MIHPDAHLRPDVFEASEKASTREGLGKGLVELGAKDPNVVVLSADVAESTSVHPFVEAYPERFVQVGVAEQNMAAAASGMAAAGKKVFMSAYAAFSPGRNWEQIKTTMCINAMPVAVTSTHAGLLTGPDGATHQMLEDIALMRTLPHMVVVSPCDAEEGRKAVHAAHSLGKPIYIRYAREKTPFMTTLETPFEIGKAQVFWKTESGRQEAEGSGKVAVFGTGPVVQNALLAARELEEEGVSTTVVNVHTIKPLDRETILREAKEAGAVVTVEEHQVHGGFGSAIAELLAAEAPVPIEFVGVQDRFGQSGKPMELWEEYGLGVSHIKDAIRKAAERAAH